MTKSRFLEYVVFIGQNSYQGIISDTIYIPSIKPKTNPFLNQITELYYTYGDSFGLYEIKLLIE